MTTRAARFGRRPRRPGRPPGRIVAARLAGAVLVLAAVYAGLAWYAGHTIPARATAGGISIGGLTEDDARRRIADRATDLESRPIDVRLDDQHLSLVPRESGLTVDAPATVAGATGLSFDPLVIWHRLNGTDDVPVRAAVDRGRLEDAIRTKGATVERAVRQGSITFPSGSLLAERPVSGRRVAVGPTADAVVAAWPADTAVEGAVERIEPRLDPVTFDAAQEVARKAVDGPVAVTAGSAKVALQPLQFAPALSMADDGGSLALHVDDKALLVALRAALPGVEVAPVAATYRVENDRPVLVPAVAGKLFDGGAAAVAMGRAITAGPRQATVPLVAAPPSPSTEQVAGYQIATELGRATVRFSSDAEPAKIANAALAAKALDGRVVAPGQPFSFNATVGDRTVARGYAVSSVPEPGAPGEDDGGVGRTASALYEAAFRAGLKLGPRTGYTAYLPGLTAGLDARASTGGPDVTFTTDQTGVLITAKATGTTIEVVLYGRTGVETTVVAANPANVVTPTATVAGKGASCKARAAQPGFDLAVNRTVLLNGAQAFSDSVSSHYAPVPATTCG